jgi:hypothetical protein
MRVGDQKKKLIFAGLRRKAHTSFKKCVFFSAIRIALKGRLSNTSTRPVADELDS